MGAIAVVRAHARQSGLNIAYQTGSANDLPYSDGRFSAVVCSDFLEHVDDIHCAMSEISRVMREGSPFVFDTLARDEDTVQQYMTRERDGRISSGTHDPRLFINPDELTAIASRYFIEIAENKDSPFGLDLKTLEDFDDKFELREVSSGSAIGHYLGYGMKILGQAKHR
jgi:2-polyprenyl-3-methyl-5-hydroxy-6-metoxy-1,4-benzoquinol methylase